MYDMRSKFKLKILIFVTVVVFVKYLDIIVFNNEITTLSIVTLIDSETKLDIINESVSINDFQFVSDDISILVYSAYLEQRPPRIRVIGITNKPNNTLVICILKYKNGKNPATVTGFIHHIPEAHKARFIAMFIHCDLKGYEEPDTVSIAVNTFDRHPRNSLQIVRNKQRPTTHKFTSCVSPMHSNYNDTAQITEWIELNRILGVDKFVFYINSVSKHVFNLLKYYEHKGLVTMLPWTLPHKLADTSHKLLHYCGQLAALNDCLYRSKGMSLYISSTDLDEFIIPQKPSHLTWSDMLSGLPAQSVYIIRCSFFSPKRSCSRKKRCMERLTIDSYKLRDDIILSSHKRSKYIAKSSDVITMGVHSTNDLNTGSEYTVNPDTGLLHHYRKDNKRYMKAAYTKLSHKTAGKYSHVLQKSLQNMTTEFKLFSTMQEGMPVK